MEQILSKFIYYPKYSDLYVSMEPDFSFINLDDKKEDVIKEILEFQNTCRLFLIERFLCDKLGLQQIDLTTPSIEKEMIVNEFLNRIDNEKYNQACTSAIGKSFEECDSLVEKYWNRMWVINELKIQFNNEPTMYNELANYSLLALAITHCFLSLEVLEYLESKSKKEGFQSNDEKVIFEKLSSFVTLFLNATTQYNELYSRLIGQSNADTQESEVLAVPCSRAFVVAPERVEDFKNVKPNPEVRQQIEDMAGKFRVNNLADGDSALKRTRKLNQNN